MRADLLKGSMADSGSKSEPSSMSLISPAMNRRAIKRTVSHSGFQPQRESNRSLPCSAPGTTRRYWIAGRSRRRYRLAQTW